MQDVRYDLLCVGTALIDSIIKGFDPIPVSASGYRAESGVLRPGGEAFNEAVAASKLGLKSAVLCALGEDPAGDIIKNELMRHGVDTSLCVSPERFSTPISTLFVSEDGSRKSITNLSHRMNFHPERYRDSFSCAKTVSIDSLFRAPFDDPKIANEVISSAYEAGMLVYADTKLPNFVDLELDDLSSCLWMIDTIFPNEDEARFFTKKKNPEDMADVLLGYGIRNVCIKLGAKGCYFKNREGGFYVPGFEVKAVDATGAGDCFIAGYLYAQQQNYSRIDSLRFANGCGALCCTQEGAAVALENAKQVKRFIEQAG